jgi:hypothetical protein
MFAIDRRTRAAVACAALMTFAGALRVAPTTAHDETAPTRQAVPPQATPKPERVTAVLPRRDPFAGGPSPAGASATPAAVVQATLPAIPAVLSALPPNAGAGGASFPFAPAEHVSAVVTGSHPFALIDDGSTTRLVSPGDRFDGERIVAIDGAGVHLETGTTLSTMSRPSFLQTTTGGRHP